MNTPETLTGRETMDSLKVHPDTVEHPRAMSLRLAIKEVSIAGDFAEFGVYKGRAAYRIESHMKGDRKLHLFDSFEGLPEDWTNNRKAGTFKLSPDEIPSFNPERVILHKGWFKDPCPPGRARPQRLSPSFTWSTRSSTSTISSAKARSCCSTNT